MDNFNVQSLASDETGIHKSQNVKLIDSDEESETIDLKVKIKVLIFR
jgi:hypothetical protein